MYLQRQGKSHPVRSFIPFRFVNKENIADDQVIWEYVRYYIRKFTLYFKNQAKIYEKSVRARNNLDPQIINHNNHNECIRKWFWSKNGKNPKWK